MSWLVNEVAHEITGHIGSTCCHRTGGENDDPKCECRNLARTIVSMVLEEAALTAENYGAMIASVTGFIPQNEAQAFVDSIPPDIAEAIREIKDET